MEAEKIENFEDLLADFLKPTQILFGHDVRRLTEAGENYGSLMLAVDIHLKENGQHKTVYAVAKKPVPSEFLQAMFQPKITFRNEITFYKEIVPLLRSFQREQGIVTPMDCFPKYVASRFNLNRDDDEIDSDVILLLENLKISGYKTEDRTVGFDYDTTLLILDDLAEFHSVPIAMRSIKPDVFAEQIASNPIFQPYKQFVPDVQAEKKGPLEITKDIMKTDEYCKKYIDKIDQVFAQNLESYIEGKNCDIREPFATIIHTDFWVNNTMVKVENGKTVKNKMVDFQFYEYGSPARDVVFFILSSVQISTIERKFDCLLDHYFDSLIRNLNILKCDTSRFSRTEFDEELRHAVQYMELSHCLCMLNPIYAPRGSVRELNEIDESTFEDMFSLGVPEGQIIRSRLIVKTCIEKGWI